MSFSPWCLCLLTFQALWLVDPVHEIYIPCLLESLYSPNLYWLAGARLSSTCVQRLVYSSHVLQYSWAKQSVCATSLDENAVARSILIRSKIVRKGSNLRGRRFLTFFYTSKNKQASAFQSSLLGLLTLDPPLGPHQNDQHTCLSA